MIDRFKPDEKIRFFSMVGTQKSEKLNHGTYVGLADNPGHFIVNCNGIQKNIKSNYCFHWEPTSIDIRKFAKDNIGRIFDLIQDALSFQYNSDADFIKIELTKNVDEIDCISVDDFTIFVEPTFAEYKEIDTIKEIPAWKLVSRFNKKKPPTVKLITSEFFTAQLLNHEISQLIFDKFWERETLIKLSEELKANEIRL